MKLFKSLLVAPATLGLLAPIAATANEVTINDFNPAEELAITNSRVDGLEARMNNIEAGSFSETTTFKGVGEFLIGASSNGGTDSDEAVMAHYHYSFDLNTSFTGEDKLNVEISSGNQITSANSDTGRTVGEVLDFGEPASDALRIEEIVSIDT